MEMSAFLERELKRSERYGRLTFGQFLDLADAQHDRIEKLEKALGTIATMYPISHAGHFHETHESFVKRLKGTAANALQK